MNWELIFWMGVVFVSVILIQIGRIADDMKKERKWDKDRYNGQDKL
jgi:hypothetical protein